MWKKDPTSGWRFLAWYIIGGIVGAIIAQIWIL